MFFRFVSLLFTILGRDMKKLKTSLNIFLRFFTNCPRISLYPFSLWSFRFFLFCFRFISFFRIKAKKILLPFRFEAKMMAVFRFRFASFRFISLHFASKRKGWQFFASVSLHFTSKQKWWQFFASFLFCFRFVPFSFRFRFLRFASMRNKRKKHFFRIEVKKFRFRFASFRFEAKITMHPRWDQSTEEEGRDQSTEGWDFST